jgi:hypothetical protein
MQYCVHVSDEYSDYSLSDRLSSPVADYVNYDVVLPQDSALKSIDRVSVSAPVVDYVNYDVVLPSGLGGAVFRILSTL